MTSRHEYENELWEACLAGDSLAWDELVRCLYPRVLKVVRDMCGGFGSHDVHELANEVFGEAFEGRGRFIKGRDIVSYIYGIARNHCLKARRKRTRHTEVSLDEGIINVVEQDSERRADPGKVLDATYTCLTVHIAIASPSLRAVMEIWKEWVEKVLHSSGVEISYPADKEIAERLGCSVDAVKSRNHAARAIIGRCVKKQMEVLEEGPCEDVEDERDEQQPES